jgi:hypothetical protein
MYVKILTGYDESQIGLYKLLITNNNIEQP